MNAVQQTAFEAPIQQTIQTAAEAAGGGVLHGLSWEAMAFAAGVAAAAQATRGLIGMRKRWRLAREGGPAFEIRWFMLLSSIGFGAIAGLLAAVLFLDTFSIATVSREQILALIGAGAAGVDFLEGVFKQAHGPAAHGARTPAPPRQTARPRLVS